jgi:2-iminobutanoate/2-iminopropanoate deaminase
VITIRNPQDRPAPESYHHGVEVSGEARTLYIAGQIGMDHNGSVPQGVEAQTRLVYANMKAVLDEAGMDFANLVKTTVFLIRPEDRTVFATVRSELTGGTNNASTLVYVAGLALPELLVEVEAIAVKAADSMNDVSSR